MSAYNYIQHITAKGRTSVRLTVGKHIYLVDFDRWGDDWIGTVQKGERVLTGALMVSRGGIVPTPAVAKSNTRLFERICTALEELAEKRMRELGSAK